MATATTGWAVDQILNAAMGHQMSTAMWEGFCAGDKHVPLRRVVVCYAPTLDVLRRAAAEGNTLIVTREHPFYLHGGLNYPYLTEGLEGAPGAMDADGVAGPARRVVAGAGPELDSAGVSSWRGRGPEIG